MPENLSLFLDPAPRTEEARVKKLSKDSILSLYGSTPSLHASSMAPHGQPLTANANGSADAILQRADSIWIYVPQGCT